MTFGYAQEAFRAAPTNERAADYLSQVVAYESNDMIGDDTFLNAISEVAYWLKFGEQIQ